MAMTTRTPAKTRPAICLVLVALVAAQLVGCSTHESRPYAPYTEEQQSTETPPAEQPEAAEPEPKTPAAEVPKEVERRTATIKEWTGRMGKGAWASYDSALIKLKGGAVAKATFDCRLFSPDNTPPPHIGTKVVVEKRDGKWVIVSVKE